MPLLVEYGLGSGHLRFYLAPKVRYNSAHLLLFTPWTILTNPTDRRGRVRLMPDSGNTKRFPYDNGESLTDDRGNEFFTLFFEIYPAIEGMAKFPKINATIFDQLHPSSSNRFNDRTIEYQITVVYAVESRKVLLYLSEFHSSSKCFHCEQTKLTAQQYAIKNSHMSNCPLVHRQTLKGTRRTDEKDSYLNDLDPKSMPHN